MKTRSIISIFTVFVLVSMGTCFLQGCGNDNPISDEVPIEKQSPAKQQVDVATLNDNGHQLGASIIIAHLEYVKDNLSNISTEITAPAKLSDTKYLNLGYVNNSVEGVEMNGGFVKSDNSNAANRGWYYKATSGISELTIPLPANRNVKILMMFEPGSDGMVTVTGANGMSTNISPSKAPSPTLINVSSVGASITIKPSMTSGGFVVYGVCIEE